MKNLELAKYILSESSEKSVLYRLFKAEIDALHLPDCDLPFPEEWVCFERDYALYRAHMDKFGIGIPVVDIGCDIGAQSAMFEDIGYTGIEQHQTKHFCDHGNYIHGTFPTEVSVDLRGKAVISNMSLGFFNDAHTGVTNEAICEALRDARYLYIAAPQSLVDMLTPYFPYFGYVSPKDATSVFPRMWMGK